MPLLSAPTPLRRLAQTGLENALGDTPVVCLAGAGRTGKSTLVRALRANRPEASCHSFADPATVAEASRDPAGFLAGLPALACLEDVDRAPGLLALLPGLLADGRKFLLTTCRTLPGLAPGGSRDLELVPLWPLAQAEREGTFPGLIDACFQGDPTRLRLAPLTRQSRQELLARILTGGYPEVGDLSAGRRESWFHGYLDALLMGRLRVLTELREVRQLIRLLVHPEADPGPARRCGDLLEELHVLASLPSGRGPRFRCFNDAGLQAHVLGLAPAALETRPGLAAPLLETFAVMELVKTAPWSGSRPTLARLRSDAQDLVILEDHRHRLVAFTTCAAATVQPGDLRGLQVLRDRVGERLMAGVVLHAGGETRAAGPGLWVLPFSALWAPRG
jgi:hypothetical protein